MPKAATVRQDLRQLRRAPGFARLVLLRMVSMAADAALQAGLATLFFFAPERAATPGGVALAFAALLGPYTVIGPWAGVLLDVWSRRRVLLVASALRAAGAIAIGALMMGGQTPWPVYVLALTCLAAGRLAGTGIGAAQPRLIPADSLMTANSLAPSLGALAAWLGTLAGLGMSLAVGPRARWTVTLLAAALYGACVLVTVGFAPRALGPDRPTNTTPSPTADPTTQPTTNRTAATLRTFNAQLIRGAAYLIRRRTPALALALMTASRVCYALVFMALILMSRGILASSADAALGVFSVILAFSAAGFALAAVVTPWAQKFISPHGWMAVSFGLAVISQGALAFSHAFALLAASAVVLGLALQSVKIAVDTIVQRDTADQFRGRAFALYDMLYNAAFVIAAAVGAAMLPARGYAPAVFAGLAGVYALLGVSAALAPRRPRA
jgi:MFS family permease